MFFKKKSQAFSVRIFLGTLLLITSIRTQNVTMLSMTTGNNTNSININIERETTAMVDIDRFKYQDGEVILLQNQHKSSEFFFTPLPHIISNLTECNTNDFSGYTELTLVVSLYTKNLVESIERHIQKNQNICRSERCTVSLLPLQSIRLFEKGLRTNESRIKYISDSQWHNYTQVRETLDFLIYASSMSTCKSLKTLITSRCYLPNFEIHYSIHRQQAIAKTLEASIEHIMNTFMYSEIHSQFSSSAVDTIALTKNDYKNLLNEITNHIINSLRVEKDFQGMHESININGILNQRLQYKQVRLIIGEDRLWNSLYWKSNVTRPDRLSTALNEVIKQDVSHPNKFHYDLLQAQKTLKSNLNFDEREKIEKFEKYLSIPSRYMKLKKYYDTHIEDKTIDKLSSKASVVTNAETDISIDEDKANIMNSFNDELIETKIDDKLDNSTDDKSNNDGIVILRRQDIETLVHSFSNYITFENDIIKPVPIDVILIKLNTLKPNTTLFSTVVYLKILKNVQVLPLRCSYEYRTSHYANDWSAEKCNNLSNIVDEFHKNFTKDLNLTKTSMGLILSNLNQTLLENFNSHKVLLNKIEKRLTEKSIENWNSSKILIDALENRLIEKIDNKPKKINSTADKTMNQTARTPSVVSTVPANIRWALNGETIAGGNGLGSATNQLYYPYDLFIDNDRTMIIADYHNHRIIEWNMNDTNGKIVAGGRGEGSRLDQLQQPRNVLIDKYTESLIVCDQGNRRVIRWLRRSSTYQGEILINNIRCSGLAMDEQKYLYVSDWDKNEIRRYQIGQDNGTLVAGGNGRGNHFNQFNFPTHIFVDQQQAIYVSDQRNHRVMKWNKDSKEGTLIGGGQGQGKALTQLYDPNGLFVDALGNVYVADSSNDRIVRWSKEATQSVVIAGGNGNGKGAHQLNKPIALSFDRHNNLYVVDQYNNRIQRFVSI